MMRVFIGTPEEGFRLEGTGGRVQVPGDRWKGSGSREDGDRFTMIDRCIWMEEYA
jgi:hypothetical protein